MNALRILLLLMSSSPVLAAELEAYDAELCELAQRMVVNALPNAFEVRVLTGEGEGFHTIQMDAEPGIVTIATTTYSATTADQPPVAVGCKMVNQARVNDVLQLSLPLGNASCRAVNELTYDRALAELTPTARDRYELEGRKLRFADDYITASGGEWLPSQPDNFITADAAGLTVVAPTVRVPWDAAAREFYQGTHHCKLITLAAMREWVAEGAFTASAELYPHAAEVCAAPSSMTSAAGSCRFWFAPAAAMFCQDFSGTGWAEQGARDACSKRHASPEAQAAASNKYGGVGGVFSTASCAARADASKPAGTCVFHCKDSDETLWHTPAAEVGSPAATQMMSRACDLYIDHTATN